MDKPLTVGQLFLRETSHSRAQSLPMPTHRGGPALHQRHARAVARVELPPPELAGGARLWGTIAARRSARGFSREPVTLAELSQVLWAVQGVTGTEGGVELRATASAGALYPNDTYLFLLNVADCPAGLGHYDVPGHALDILEKGDFSNVLATACLGQGACREAGVVLCWVAVISRATWKYADRAYRYAFLDAGHLGAQAQLAATALDLGSLNIAAFYDEDVNLLLGLEGDEEFAVYLTAIGHQ